MQIILNQVASAANFDEALYLRSNPDVAAAVANGRLKSGRQHFDTFGEKEGRRIDFSRDIAPLRKQKMARLAPHLRHDLPMVKKGDKLDYLSEELRRISGIEETTAVSSHGYDGNGMALVNRYADGLVLDCGAGSRDIYFENVVNFEIVDYASTDVLGVGEELPFKDGTFDAIISVAVLEHVKDPFRCAREIVRVLKPGGELYCAVPFLQPLHGYPHHYYNMSHQGLKALFDHSLTITGQDVLASTGPIWSLTWFLQRWSAQLPDRARETFLGKTVADLIHHPHEFLAEPWVTDLPKEAQFELASATVVFATKPNE
jgi:SAM-dependent methyltransferase